MSLEHDDDILDLEDFEEEDDLRLDNLHDLEYTNSMDGLIHPHSILGQVINTACEMGLVEEDDDELPGQLDLFGEDDDQ